LPWAVFMRVVNVLGPGLALDPRFPQIARLSARVPAPQVFCRPRNWCAGHVCSQYKRSLRSPCFRIDPAARPSTGNNAKMGIQVRLFDPDRLRARVEQCLPLKNALYRVCRKTAVVSTAVVEHLLAFADTLRPYVCDTRCCCTMPYGETSVSCSKGNWGAPDPDHGIILHDSSSPLADSRGWRGIPPHASRE